MAIILAMLSKVIKDVGARQRMSEIIGNTWVENFLNRVPLFRLYCRVCFYLCICTDIIFQGYLRGP
jgi:hypothetical protein